MKKIIPLMLMLLGAIATQAQNRIQTYVDAGGVFSQVEGDELKGFNHIGFNGGVGAIVHLGDRHRWAMTLETNYNCRGIYNKKNSSDNYYNIDLDLHYVDIPLTLLFRDPYGGLEVGLGMAYSRLLAQPHGIVSFNPRFFIPDSSNMAFLKNDLAAAAEIRFTIWENLKMSIRYQRSVIPIKKEWTFHMADRTWSNDCFNSSVTLRLLWQFGEEEKTHHKYRKRRR
jgi:hypothetical protein